LDPKPTLSQWYVDIAGVFVFICMLIAGIWRYLWQAKGLNGFLIWEVLEPLPIYVQGLLIYYATVDDAPKSYFGWLTTFPPIAFLACTYFMTTWREVSMVIRN
jgi:hypothetical protein